MFVDGSIGGVDHDAAEPEQAPQQRLARQHESHIQLQNQAREGLALANARFHHGNGPNPQSQVLLPALPPVLSPPQPQSRVRHRGSITFEQAKNFKGHKDNFVFLWKGESFILICDSDRCGKKTNKHYGSDPFVNIGRKTPAMAHFNHLEPHEIIAKYAWRGESSPSDPRQYIIRDFCFCFVLVCVWDFAVAPFYVSTWFVWSVSWPSSDCSLC